MRQWLAAAFAVVLVGCERKTVRAPQPATAPGLPSRSPASRERAPVETARGPETYRIPADGRLLSTEEGIASWYGTVYDKRRAADGTIYDQDAMTAASRTLPLGVLARVTNLSGGQVAVVRITDRGPFVPGRILDLSRGAARALGMDRMGVGKVRVEAYAVGGFQAPVGRWCVQIGAFAEAEDALQMKNDLMLRYPGAKVVAFDGPTGSWVRLTLPAADRDGSAAVAAQVRVPDPGVEAYVTRLN